MANVEEHNQTPISEWAVSEDEDDLFLISQLIEKDKTKTTSEMMGDVSELYVDVDPPLYLSVFQRTPELR